MADDPTLDGVKVTGQWAVHDRSTPIRMMSLNITATTPEGIGDGSRWVFDSLTVQPDLRPYELMQILGFAMSVPDGLMSSIAPHLPVAWRKSLLRHFQHRPPAENV